MPTRFHLPSSGAAPISPNFDAGWEQQGAGDRIAFYPKGLTPLVSTLTDASRTVPITTTQQILTRQFVGPPMRARRIHGTVSLVVRCSENANTNNAHLAYVLRVLSVDGGTVRGTLASSMTTGTEFALTASAATRIFSAIAVTALTSQEGDRIVLELGVHAQGPTAAGSAILRFGTSAATDFALTSALTTDLNPWIEFSEDLFGTRLNNYQFVRADSGLSVGEKIR